jgi:hypothetical protein
MMFKGDTKTDAESTYGWYYFGVVSTFSKQESFITPLVLPEKCQDLSTVWICVIILTNEIINIICK